MFKAGNLLGAHKRCIYWVAKENGIKPTKQTLKKKKKANLPRFSCSFSVCAFIQPHGGEFCFFPFLRLGHGGRQGLSAKPDEMCSFNLHETIVTWRPQLL